MTDISFDWTPSMLHVASTDIGMRRSNNQDSYIVSLSADLEEWHQHGHLFVVADGMGAHAAGELASKLAVDHIAHIYSKHPEMGPPERLKYAMREANEEIHRRGEANLDFHHMGTTCSALLLLPQGALAGHVGDSRIYQLRGERLFQLTFDHSLVWEMRAAGQIGSSDDSHSVPKNVITRSLGPQEAVKVDLEGPFPVEVGDAFLLCSDGLTGRIEDRELATILASLPPRDAAQLCLNLANLRGGPDNITAIVVQITGPQMASAAVRASPLIVGRAHNSQPTIHVAWWVSMGVTGLLAASLAATHSLQWAWLPLLISVLLLVAILVQKFELLTADGIRLSGGRRLGKGPYRKCAAEPLREFTEHLLAALEGGRQTAEQRGWQADWSEFQSRYEAVRQEFQRGDFQAAMSQLVPVSSFLVELAQQQSRLAD